MTSKAELSQAYNKLKKNQHLYNERFARYFHDDLAEKNLPDIRTFDNYESLLTNVWFIDKLLQTPLKKDTLSIMDVDTFNTPEIICSILENKRWEALPLLKLENKDADLFNLLGEISPIPSRLKLFRDSDFFKDLQKAHPQLFENVCLENPLNILDLKPSELTDEIIEKYLTRFSTNSMSLELNQFIFNSKSPEWWLSNPNTLFLLLKKTSDISLKNVSSSSDTLKYHLPFDFSQLDPTNENHKFLGLLVVSFNAKTMHSFFDTFGTDLNTLQQAMGAVKDYSLTSHDLMRFIKFENQKHYNIFNQDYENRISIVLKNSIFRTNSDLNVTDSVIPFLRVESYLLKNNMHDHEIFDLSGSNNYLELFKIFYNKKNNTHDDNITLDKHIEHLNRTLESSENPMELLSFLVSANSSRKTFFKYFAEKFNMSTVEINSLNPEDFYQNFETHFLEKAMYQDIQSMDKLSSIPTKTRKF